MEEIHVMKGFLPYFRLLKVYNAENFRGSREKIRQNISLLLFVLTFYPCEAIFLALAAWNYSEKRDYMDPQSLPLLCIGSQMIVTHLSGMRKNRLISRALWRLQNAIEARADMQIYKTLAEEHAFITHNILFKMPIATILTAMVLCAMLPISYSIFGYPAPKQWIIPIDLHSMPWLGVYSGFYVMLFIETIACVFHPFAVLTLASFLLGTCAYIDGMVKDLKGQMIQLERETTKLSEARLEKQIGGVVWKLLNEIRFHEEIIELANMSQDIISASVFYQLLVCASIIALNLLALETQNWLSLERIVSIYEVLVYIALTFLYCNVSDTVTTNLYDIGDTFFGCLWYTLPLAQQKLFILPIQRSQRRFHLTGLGLVDCSLRNFLSIIRTALSYYLILRDVQ